MIDSRKSAPKTKGGTSTGEGTAAARDGDGGASGEEVEEEGDEDGEEEEKEDEEEEVEDEGEVRAGTSRGKRGRMGRRRVRPASGANNDSQTKQ